MRQLHPQIQRHGDGILRLASALPSNFSFLPSKSIDNPTTVNDQKILNWTSEAADLVADRGDSTIVDEGFVS